MHLGIMLGLRVDLQTGSVGWLILNCSPAYLLMQRCSFLPWKGTYCDVGKCDAKLISIINLVFIFALQHKLILLLLLLLFYVYTIIYFF